MITPRVQNDSIDRIWARVDLSIAGAEVRQMDDRIFRVTHPVDYVPGFVRQIADFASDYSVRPGRRVGTWPNRHEGFDFSDPAQLAANVALDHDYPDPDRLGEMPTER